MAREMQQSPEWQAEQLRSFHETARNYLVEGRGAACQGC